MEFYLARHRYTSNFKTEPMILHNWENPISNERNELVFANRNKNYGAYYIRKSYERNLLFAFILTISSGIFLAVLPKIYQHFFPTISLPKTIITSVILDVKQFEDKNNTPIKEPEKPKEIKSKPSGSTNSLTIPLVVDSSDHTILDQEHLSKANIGIGDNKDSSKTIEILPDNTNGNGKPDIRLHSEEMPSFPGGEEAMLSFIAKYLHYPEEAKGNKISGIVYISFVVDEKGDLQNIVTKRGIGGGCEQEAMRVLNKMPRWNPGKDNGRPVNVEFVLPIQFTLQ